MYLYTGTGMCMHTYMHTSIRTYVCVCVCTYVAMAHVYYPMHMYVCNLVLCLFSQIVAVYSFASVGETAAPPTPVRLDIIIPVVVIVVVLVAIATLLIVGLIVAWKKRMRTVVSVM